MAYPSPTTHTHTLYCLGHLSMTYPSPTTHAIAYTTQKMISTTKTDDISSNSDLFIIKLNKTVYGHNVLIKGGVY